MTKFLAKALQSGPAGGLATIAVLAGTAAVCTTLTLPARAGDYDVGSIHISQPWSQATPKGAATGVGYMTLTNKGTVSDKVSCVSDDASAQCQIHSMTMDGGVMKMRPVEGGLEIKPGESVNLKPGGNHMMFVSLKHPLEQGQMIKVTLQFEHAGTIDIDCPVLAMGARPPGASAGGSMMQGSGRAMQGGGAPGGSMMPMDKH